MRKIYHQGNVDYLCGLYASINATLLSTDKLATFSRAKVRSWFQSIIADLSKHRKLLAVHKEGSDIEMMESYIKIIQAQMPEKINLTYYKPFLKNTRTSTAIKKISVISTQPNTAVIIGISGLYEHWSLVAKTTADRIYLNDSDGLTFLYIKNMPLRYNLIVANTIVVTAEAVQTKYTANAHKKSVQTKC